MKICPVGAELFHAHGETCEGNGCFSQFCERAEKRVNIHDTLHRTECVV
jgi:hypothetical protein